ncbi:hypothetical protein KKF92_01455 [Patescibacteria group bacterium]|nr:hypothetical protein [Patescibacteria group bacterium]
MLGDFFIVLFTGLLIWLVAGLVLPFILIKNFDLPDKGWGFGRIAGWLAIGLPVWFLANLGLPVNTQLGVWVVILLLLGRSMIFTQKNWPQLKKVLVLAKPFILAEEILFWLGYFFLSFIRGFQPDVNGLEKFMDHGFMAGYLRSPTLPAGDMWLAGFDINYYTFGHFLGSLWMRIWGALPEVSYNLLLALIMGLTLLGSFQVITTLLDQTKQVSLKAKLFAGSLGSILMVFAGNSMPIWSRITKGTWQGFWYPDATRFIPNTIHEFPAYSFIVSDLHGHVWNMALVLPFICLLFIWFSKLWQIPVTGQKLEDLWREIGWLSVLIGGTLGLMASTSTWGTMIYGLFLVILSGLFLITQRRGFKTLVFCGVVVGLSAFLIASPWFFNFESISEGIRMVTERSDLSKLIILWTGHVVMAITAGLVALKLFRHSQNSKQQPVFFFVIVMLIMAVTLLILPEFIYFKDIYPTHPRANTMFKLTFEAFIIMILMTGWLIGILSTLKPVWQKRLAGGLVAIFVVAVLSYPYFGYRDFYGGLKTYKGLDGLSWLQTLHPDDYAGLKWLNTNTLGRPVVLEAVGESYTTFARVSTYTGLQTVLGWRVHEWLWRGSFDIASQRTEEVKTIYLTPFFAEAQTKLNQYNVEYIFVGDKEREAYPTLDVPGLKRLGKVVFAQNQTFIVRRAVR